MTARLRLLIAPLALTMALAACGGDDDGDGDTGGGDDASTGGQPDAGTGGADAGDTTDAAPPDAAPTMSIYEIIPQAASRLVTTELTVLGYLLEDGASLTLTNCDTATVYDLSDTVAVATDGRSLSATLVADETREQGIYTVTVTNPDQATDSLECAFRISADLPPTVTSVVPATAYRGVSGDGVSSDTTVNIEGTGFVSTPNVRWVKTDGTRTYDAISVGFIDSNNLTAVVPSETLGMEPGDYHVYVVNPNLLTGQWMEEDAGGNPVPGIFTITTTPPPRIDSIDPSRIPNNVCTTQVMDITGAGFDAGATVWWVAPEGVNCTGLFIDESGNRLCPMAVTYVDAGNLDTQFTECPGNGPWPIVVRNPDGQYDMYFTVEVRPNNAGHLSSQQPWIVSDNTMNTPRYSHGTDFGFGAFGDAFIYVAGGQDADGAVLSTIEYTQLDIFGRLSPFTVAQQYGSAAEPRIINALTSPRTGGVLLRVGKQLFMAGGASQPSDVTGTVTALSSVERAAILSYFEMPGIQLPKDLDAGALPTGSWYYQVSAIGPWGESLGSREVIAFQSGGRIEVCWDAPDAAGATSYNVYRSLASDGRAQTAALIAVEVAGPCFIDDGAGMLAPAPGNLRGTVAAGGALAVGSHEYRVSAHLTLADSSAWETYAGYPVSVQVNQTDVDAGNASIQLVWDAIPNAVGYSLYKLDPDSGEYLLLDTGGMLTATTFTDAGAAFDVSGLMPREEIRPLQTGALSLWDGVSVPNMNFAREGADGVVIEMDPATSNGLVGRILVAGGRTQNTAPADPAAPWYLTNAESLGINADGSLEASWYNETPQFNFARVFYALVTTQNRNTTPYPPDPEEPPCGDFDGDGFVSCDCGGDDCNDADPDIYPGATEICGDGIDQDCDAGCGGSDVECACTTDADGDGYLSIECGADDCCDSGTEDSLGCSADTADDINPGKVEICENGIDEDCDGADDTCTVVDLQIQKSHPATYDTGSSTETVYAGGPTATGYSGSTVFNVTGNEPVYVVAVLGDDSFQASANQGLESFEACQVNDVTGYLDCGATWVLQTAADSPQSSFAMDALLYFDYLYPFYGIASETIADGGNTRQVQENATSRYPIQDPNTAAGQVLGSFQSSNVQPTIPRAYYKMVRLMAYIYAVGGWTDTGTTGTPGPTGTVERHAQ